MFRQTGGEYALHLGPPIKPPRIDESGLQYRLYFLDGVGRITNSHEFYAENDAAAIKIAANIPAAANASSAKYRFLFGMSVSRSTKSIPGTKTSQLIMTKGQKRVSGDTSETVTMASEAAIDTANQSLAMLNSGLRSISAA